MTYYMAFACVLFVLALGASYFIRRYKETKLESFRLVCWWGRIASGILMVAGGVLFVLMMGMFIDTVIKVLIYAGQNDLSLNDIFSEMFSDNGFLKFIFVLVIEVLAYYFGRKGMVIYNEMFLSEYR